ncbi:YfhD family protein [Paenibacillus farraposensis]|uniref:YfhD family protein n=1 Tax=Paenibacillus farraposensis TaxID=2807095 RepID=A0ABW4DB00_9BACL|nr:YfhD family protein [Paenibacillus farraposensis]MCC3380091.1 YfhD family protein [Paenibacillus farraposensis]
MPTNKRFDKVLTKTEKIKRVQAAKNEDVEFSAEQADAQDLEAIRRSEAADRRQQRIITDSD